MGLRPLARKDAPRWEQLRNDNVAWLGPWESTRPPSGGAPSVGYRALTRDLIRQGRQGRAYPFVVTYDDLMVGQLTVTGITWASARWAQMGYWIDEKYAGRGIMTRAVAMAVDHCLLSAGLHRIEIAIRPENTASLRIVEKLRFTKIGLAPKYMHIDGMWRDHLLFAITIEQIPGGLLRMLDQPSG